MQEVYNVGYVLNQTGYQFVQACILQYSFEFTRMLNLNHIEAIFLRATATPRRILIQDPTEKTDPILNWYFIVNMDNPSTVVYSLIFHVCAP